LPEPLSFRGNEPLEKLLMLTEKPRGKQKNGALDAAAHPESDHSAPDLPPSGR
jgi:hypothetical protein